MEVRTVKMTDELNHRERVHLALNHRQTDRIPMDLGSTVVTGMTLGAYSNLAKHLGLEVQKPAMLSTAFQVVEPDERIMKSFDIDFRPIFYRPPKTSKAEFRSNGTFIDDWGIIRYKPKTSLYFDIIDSPLKDASLDDLNDFDWPDPLDPGRFEGIEEEARFLHEQSDYALVGPGTDTNLFELAWWLRGFENFLMDLIINQDFIHALFRRLVDYRKAMIGHYLELIGHYLDVVYVGDDLAIQTGPLMAMKTFREMVKPYLAEYFKTIKDRTQAKLLLHCCGGITELLDDLIEIGVDIINPVQVSAKGMNTKELKRRFGDRISFWGAIDTQHVLPRGSPEEVRNEVRQRVADLGVGGGYVLAPVHNIQPDVPPENICALYQEGKVASVSTLAS